MTLRDSSDFAGAGWDAAAYDRVADPQTRWGVAVLDRLELGGSETVLDAGCGTGRVTHQLLRRLPRGRVIAVDASAEMLAHAARRLGSDRVRFVHRDLLELSPADVGGEPVDAVLSTATFHWVDDHDRLFTRLAAVLRGGGSLVAQCAAAGNVARLEEVVRHLGGSRPGRRHYASAADTRRRLERAGFGRIDVWTHDEPTAFADAAALCDFLEAVCLRDAVAALPREERMPFIERVVEQMPDRVIDYVRLNIVATRR